MTSLIENLRERNRRFVEESHDDRPSLRTLSKRVDDAISLSLKIANDAANVRANVMIPVEGRRKTLQDGAMTTIKQIQALENAIAEEMRMLGNERRFRESLPTPAKDPVSIQIRAELRAHLRSMDMQQRLGATKIENLDAETLAAILEAPPALSGLPPLIVDGLRSRLVRAKGGVPNFDDGDSEIAALTSAALKVARSAAADASEMAPTDFEARASSVRVEMTAGIKRDDADLATLLAVAVS